MITFVYNVFIYVECRLLSFARDVCLLSRVLLFLLYLSSRLPRIIVQEKFYEAMPSLSNVGLHTEACASLQCIVLQNKFKGLTGRWHQSDGFSARFDKIRQFQQPTFPLFKKQKNKIYPSPEISSVPNLIRKLHRKNFYKNSIPSLKPISNLPSARM